MSNSDKTEDKRHTGTPGLGGALNGQIDRMVQRWSQKPRSQIDRGKAA